MRRAALATIRRLLSRMALTACASAVLHPLLRVLTDPSEELRRDGADTICALALALGPDLALFAPAVRKVGSPPLPGWLQGRRHLQGCMNCRMAGGSHAGIKLVCTAGCCCV